MFKIPGLSHVGEYTAFPARHRMKRLDCEGHPDQLPLLLKSLAGLPCAALIVTSTLAGGCCGR